MTETAAGDISAPPSSRWVSLSRKVHGKLRRRLSEILPSAVHHRKVSTSSVTDGVATGCCLRSPDSGNDDEDLPGLLMVRLGVCFPSVPICGERSSEITLTAATVRPQGKPGVEVNVYLPSVQLHWSIFHVYQMEQMIQNVILPPCSDHDDLEVLLLSSRFVFMRAAVSVVVVSADFLSVSSRRARLYVTTQQQHNNNSVRLPPQLQQLSVR